MTPAIFGVMRVRNEEPHITEVFSAQHFCKKILVLNNRSTDHTKEIAQSFRNVEVIDTPFPDILDEGRDRTFLSAKIAKYNPEWICAMSGDEVLEQDAWKKLQKYLGDSSVKCIGIHSLNYWNDTETLRTDGCFAQGYRPSFWRFVPGLLTYDFAHCGLPLQLNYTMTLSDIALWHYGGMTLQRRRDTTALYERIDPEHRYGRYDQMLQNDPGGPPASENITGETFKLQSVKDYLASVENKYSRRKDDLVG